MQSISGNEDRITSADIVLYFNKSKLGIGLSEFRRNLTALRLVLIETNFK